MDKGINVDEPRYIFASDPLILVPLRSFAHWGLRPSHRRPMKVTPALALALALAIYATLEQPST
jgi:hypothetical protein